MNLETSREIWDHAKGTVQSGVPAKTAVISQANKSLQNFSRDINDSNLKAVLNFLSTYSETKELSLEENKEWHKHLVAFAKKSKLDNHLQSLLENCPKLIQSRDRPEEIRSVLQNGLRAVLKNVLDQAGTDSKRSELIRVWMEMLPTFMDKFETMLKMRKCDYSKLALTAITLLSVTISLHLISVPIPLFFGVSEDARETIQLGARLFGFLNIIFTALVLAFGPAGLALLLGTNAVAFFSLTELTYQAG